MAERTSYTDEEIAGMVAEIEQLRSELEAYQDHEWEVARRREQQLEIEQSAEVPCRYCDGTGDYPETMDDEYTILTFGSSYGERECGLCKGKGLIRLLIPDTPVNCRHCKGTGRRKYAYSSGPSHLVYTCDHCDGFGIIPLTGKVSQLSYNPRTYYG